MNFEHIDDFSDRLTAARYFRKMTIDAIEFDENGRMKAVKGKFNKVVR